MHSFDPQIVMKLITRTFVILICVNYRTVLCEKNYTVGSVYIDDITNKYINIEEKLWALIGSSNQSDIILSIHQEHLNFFRTSFSIERRKTEGYRTSFVRLFGWEVQGLNSEIDFVKSFELHDSIEDITMDDSVQLAKTYVGYSTMMTNIYNRTVETNVFDHIRQVSLILIFLHFTINQPCS